MKNTNHSVSAVDADLSEWVAGADDAMLFKVFEDELYTPVVGDVMDVRGLSHQFLTPAIQPINLERPKVIGRAMPMIYADVTGPQEKPFGLLTEALDQVGEGEVVLVGGGSKTFAVWGEILTATVRVRGARGAVIDGWHRDTPRVLEQQWPVFSYGAYAQDAGIRGRVIDYRCPLEINGTHVEPGDLLFGDVDGVLVIPKNVERDVIAEALQKARGEKVVRKAIEEGMSSTDAFKKYGIL